MKCVSGLKMLYCQSMDILVSLLQLVVLPVIITHFTLK